MFSLSDTPRQGQGVQNNTVAVRIGFSVVYVQFILHSSVGAGVTKQDCHNQNRVQCGLCLVYLTHLGRGRGYKTRLSQSEQGLVWFMFSLSATPRQGQRVQNKTVTIRIRFSVVYVQFILHTQAGAGGTKQDCHNQNRVCVVYVQFICNTTVGAEGTKQDCHNQDRVQCGLCLVYLQHLGRGRGYKTRLSQSGQGLVWFIFSLCDTPRQGQGVQNNTVTIRIGFSVVYVQFILHTQAGAGGTKQHCHNHNRVQCGLCLVYLTHLGRGRGYKTTLSQSGQGLVWFMFSLSYTPRQGQMVQNNTVTIRIGFSEVYVQFIRNTSVGAEGTKQDCHNQDTVQCGLCLVYLQHLGRGRGYKTRLSQSG